MLPEEFLYQLNQANPIETVVSSYVSVQRNGPRLKCLCPFHSEKTPSCVIYTEDNHFYCFGCHTGGSTITFIQKIEGVGFMDAVQILAERAGLTVPKQDGISERESQRRARVLELNRAAARFYFDQLSGADKRGLLYLKERALRPEIVRKYGLGYAGDSWDALTNAMQAKGFTEDELLDANLCSRSGKTGRLYDRFRNRVIFPIFDLKGSVIAFGGRTIEKDGTPKYLNSSDTPVFKKGRNLFSMQFAKKSQSKRMILAEGYMDVIAIHQGGFENVVASLGTALTPDQCRLIRQYAEEVIIAYDSDAAGQNATLKAINLLRAAGLRPKILHIKDAKDPDEYLKKFGPGFFRQLLEEAEDAMAFELGRCKDGVDTATEDGAITALHKAVTVLSGIENEMDRDIYLSRVAKEYDIKTEVLQGQVRAELRKRQRSEKKQAFRAAEAHLAPVHIVQAGQIKESRAECCILAWLMKNPEDVPRFWAQLPPERFVTELHRRIYVCYHQRMEEGYSSDLGVTLFAEDFSVDEQGYIIEILTNYEVSGVTKEMAEASIQILLDYAPATDAGALSDEDFAAAFAKKRARK